MRHKVLLCILIGFFIIWVSPVWGYDYGTITSGITFDLDRDIDNFFQNGYLSFHWEGWSAYPV